MKKLKAMKLLTLSLSLCLLILSSGYAQIVAPDTVCLNEPVTFTTGHHAVHYAWTIDTAGTKINLGRQFNATNVRALYTGAPVNTPAAIAVANDNGVYYVFTPNFFQNSVARLAFTNGLNAPPVTTNMGNFGVLASSTLEGMEVVRDDNGQWYAFVLDGPRLVRVDFGTSLANNPTTGVAIPLTYTPNYELQLTIKKYNNEWIAFTGGYGNPTVTRIDFGTSITNTNPTFTQLPTGALSLQSPGYFTIHEQNGEWFMLVNSLHGSRNGISLARFDFGADLRNNNPTLTSLGNPGNQFTLARAILTISDCDSFYSLTMNENATFTHLDFRNNMRNNSPVATALGAFVPAPVGKQTLHSYWANDTLFLLASDFRGHNVYSYPLLTLTAPVRAIRYHNPDFTHTFTTPGVYNVTVQCDQAITSGPKIMCKQIVVVDGREGFLGPDTVLCDAQSYRLDASQGGATGYRWNTGETTPAISASSPGGTYWVEVSGQVCGQYDTVEVRFASSPYIDLGNDIEACEGDHIVLASRGGTYVNPAYQWSNGSTAPSVTAINPGMYALTISDQGCESSDTVMVVINPAPEVFLGNDTSVCVSAFPLTLTSAQSPGSTYLWSNGYSTHEMQVIRGGRYWLEVRIGNCIASDTIRITGIEDPDVFIGHDTVICEQFPLRVGAEIAGATYSWNTGDTEPYIHVNATDGYVLAVNLDGCTVYDTIAITALPPPDIDLGGDRDICPQQTIVLNGSYGQNSSYIWNTGDRSRDIAVTSAGTYAVVVTSEHGCIGGDTVLLRFYPKPTVSLGTDTTVCEETPLRLEAWALNSDSLIWSDGSVGVSLLVRYGGDYIVTGVNKCGTASDTITLSQIFCDIWVPNAFTPDGNGLNDIFRVLGNIGRLEGFSLSVFNRWGERVFLTQDKLRGWDGIYKGIPAQSGTYVYLLRYSVDGRPQAQHGNFHLLR